MEDSHPKEKGEKTEAIILAELIKRRYSVLLPFGDNQRFDLVIYHNSNFIRMQCKTGRYRNGCVVFNTISVQCNMNKTYRKSYDGDIDYFITYCYELDQAYVIPVGDVPKGNMSLRVEEPKNSMTKTIRWAKEYSLDNWQI